MTLAASAGAADVLYRNPSNALSASVPTADEIQHGTS